MRQIGTLPDPQNARLLADYLQSLSIETRLEPAGQGVVVWVCDEDRVAQARQEFAQFQANPTDERYRQAARTVQRQEPAPEPAPRRRRPPSQHAAGPEFPICSLLFLLSLMVTVLFWAPETRGAIARWCFIRQLEHRNGSLEWRDHNRLDEVRKFELWRLVTPIFIHMHVLHLLFNMFCLWDMGRPLERLMGTRRFALFVLLVAVLSNLGQYYFAKVRLDGWTVVTQSSPAFGGLSGVGYALFGFLWIRAVYDPESGLFITRGTVIVMMGWFFLCLTGEVGPIANTAHLVGLSLGMLLGYASAWRNNFGRGRD